MQQAAGEHTRFAPDAFAEQVGKSVPLTIDGQQCTTALVVAAEVAGDGSRVLLTYEVPDELRAWFEHGAEASHTDGPYLAGRVPPPVPLLGSDGPWPPEVSGPHLEVSPRPAERAL